MAERGFKVETARASAFGFTYTQIVSYQNKEEILKTTPVLMSASGQVGVDLFIAISPTTHPILHSASVRVGCGPLSGRMAPTFVPEGPWPEAVLFIFGCFGFPFSFIMGQVGY